MPFKKLIVTRPEIRYNPIKQAPSAALLAVLRGLLFQVRGQKTVKCPNEIKLPSWHLMGGLCYRILPYGIYDFSPFRARDGRKEYGSH